MICMEEQKSKYPCSVCGKHMCKECADKYLGDLSEVKSCPWCRSRLWCVSRLEKRGDVAGALVAGTVLLSASVDGEDVASPEPLLRRAADRGSKAAAHNLGTCYWMGWFVEKDYEEAARLLEHAGAPGSLMNLAGLYQESKAEAKRIKALEKAADGLCPTAFTELAKIKDEDKLRFLEIGFALGDMRAIKPLIENSDDCYASAIVRYASEIKELQVLVTEEHKAMVREHDATCDDPACAAQREQGPCICGLMERASEFVAERAALLDDMPPPLQDGLDLPEPSWQATCFDDASTITLAVF